MISVHYLSALKVGINKLKTETTQTDQVNSYCRLQSNKKWLQTLWLTREPNDYSIFSLTAGINIKKWKDRRLVKLNYVQSENFFLFFRLSLADGY